MGTARRKRILAKVVIWAACLAPVVSLGLGALSGGLGSNPIETITHRTGWWALSLLTVTLAVTPLRRLARRPGWIRYRRLLGLLAFFYATLHLLTYLVLDQFFGWSYIVEDIVERPFITIGFLAWLILLALASTSTSGWIRRLRKNWQRLHRLVYVAVIAAGVHFLWKVKADTRDPLVFLSVIAVLLAIRAWAPWKRRLPIAAERGRAGSRIELKAREAPRREAPLS
jgi:sulfoxide reductase heme-binding subunit YedZ